MGFFTLPHVPLKGQNVVFDNGGVAFPSPFLTSWPNYPTLLNTNKLQLGFGYPMRTNRFDVYGGGIRNGFLSTTGLGGYYMKWQQQNFWGLNLGTSAAPAGFTYYPGIRYLGNRHNWFGYAATFGLKERISNQILDNPEAMHFTIVENYEQKDAVITMEYPNTIDESKRPNLVFESIALDSNIGGSGDVITQLATLTNSGNLGFRTADPQARIEIYGDAGLTNEKAFLIKDNNGVENYTILNNITGIKVGINNSSPTANLDLIGSAKFYQTSTATAGFEILGPPISPSTTPNSMLKSDGVDLYSDNLKRLTTPGGQLVSQLVIDKTTGKITPADIPNMNNQTFWSVNGNSLAAFTARIGTTALAGGKIIDTKKMQLVKN